MSMKGGIADLKNCLSFLQTRVWNMFSRNIDITLFQNAKSLLSVSCPSFLQKKVLAFNSVYVTCSSYVYLFISLIHLTHPSPTPSHPMHKQILKGLPPLQGGCERKTFPRPLVSTKRVEPTGLSPLDTIITHLMMVVLQWGLSGWRLILQKF